MELPTSVQGAWPQSQPEGTLQPLQAQGLRVQGLRVQGQPGQEPEAASLLRERQFQQG